MQGMALPSACSSGSLRRLREGVQAPSPLRREDWDEGAPGLHRRQGMGRNGSKWKQIKSLPLLATRNEATTIETGPRWPGAYE